MRSITSACSFGEIANEDSSQNPVKARLLLFVFSRPSQSEISQFPYASPSSSFCINSGPISSITSRKYQTHESRKASPKSISLFHFSFQNTSPLHWRTESAGSMIPCSKAVRDEIILNVEHGERLVCASSLLYTINRKAETSYTTAAP
ncbi:hypothetical protein IMSAGC002_04739 [Lachnospiraceae bacterium]|nr:hypothetical protein IMSAGC002_04739 [Lachnospiraceae bacterium]